MTATHQSDNRPLSHANYTDSTVPIDISYEADVWGRIKYNVNSSARRAEATAADLETVNRSVHAELATYYFSLRGLDAEKELLDETVEAYENPGTDRKPFRREHRIEKGMSPKRRPSSKQHAPKPSM